MERKEAMLKPELLKIYLDRLQSGKEEPDDILGLRSLIDEHLADLDADSNRLDKLERTLLDHNGGHEFALQSDYEDGIWVARVLRGHMPSLPLEVEDAHHKTLREAIDAIPE